MEKTYQFKLDFQANQTLKGSINNVNVYLITHSYPLVKPQVVMDNVRMASLEDIAAMKLNAISGNGTRLKDFIDIASLSAKLTLADMVMAYRDKYDSRNPAMVIKSLDYHEDINFNEPVQMLDSAYSWQKTQARLLPLANRRPSCYCFVFQFNVDGLFISIAFPVLQYSVINILSLQRVTLPFKMEPRIHNIGQLRASVIVYWISLYDIRKVRRMTGHSSIRSTETYMDYDVQQLKMVYSSFIRIV